MKAWKRTHRTYKIFVVNGAFSSISIATIERAFSVMKIVKTRLRNRMEDDFLSTYLLTYVGKDIARDFDVDSIIDAFYIMKERRTQL
ncbi:hypothetical protein ACSBR2_004978 [Camellia fascicularis]